MASSQLLLSKPDILSTICSNISTVQSLGLFSCVSRLTSAYLSKTAQHHWTNAGREVCGDDYWKQPTEDQKYRTMIQVCPWKGAKTTFRILPWGGMECPGCVHGYPGHAHEYDTVLVHDLRGRAGDDDKVFTNIHLLSTYKDESASCEACSTMLVSMAVVRGDLTISPVSGTIENLRATSSPQEVEIEAYKIFRKVRCHEFESGKISDRIEGVYFMHDNLLIVQEEIRDGGNAHCRIHFGSVEGYPQPSFIVHHTLSVPHTVDHTMLKPGGVMWFANMKGDVTFIGPRCRGDRPPRVVIEADVAPFTVGFTKTLKL